MADLTEAAASIDRLMRQVGAHFIGEPKITLIVRNPDGESAPGSRDLIMTNDDLAEAARAIRRRQQAAREKGSVGRG